MVLAGLWEGADVTAKTEQSIAATGARVQGDIGIAHDTQIMNIKILPLPLTSSLYT